MRKYENLITVVLTESGRYVRLDEVKSLHTRPPPCPDGLLSALVEPTGRDKLYLLLHDGGAEVVDLNCPDNQHRIAPVGYSYVEIVSDALLDSWMMVNTGMAATIAASTLDKQ